MTEQVCLNVDFNQIIVCEDVIEVLANNLQENLNRDVLKVSLKESLAIVAKGNRLQCGPANDLLLCILRSLSIPKVEPSESDDETDSESNDESEPKPEQKRDSENEENEEIEDDESLSQMLNKARKKAGQTAAKKGKHVPQGSKIPDSKKTKPDSNMKKTNSQSKNKELCRFYARGQCTRKQECRFNHPSICKKFRKFGSISTDKSGCDGKCDALHPNACRNSVRDRTCSWQDCKFFHLKGTRRINRNTNGPQNNQQNTSQNQIGQQNQNRKGTGNTGGQQWTNNRNHNHNQIQNNNQNYNNSAYSNGNPSGSNNNNGPYQGGQNARNIPVFQKDLPELASTLQEIMRRLAAMETRQTMLPPIHMATQLSPTVPQPGTQTQGQWGSPNHWTQSQY